MQNLRSRHTDVVKQERSYRHQNDRTNDKCCVHMNIIFSRLYFIYRFSKHSGMINSAIQQVHCNFCSRDFM